MPQIKFQNRDPLDISSGENLMKVLRDAEIPVASSCQGDGICGKCKLEVLAGMENLNSPNPTEQYLKERFNLGKNIRISCQCVVLGNIHIHASYW